MKITVIGGTGLIGSKLVAKLLAQQHTVIAASPDSGINTITGVGLARALKDADVVVDVSNSRSFEAKAVMDFFKNLRAIFCRRRCMPVLNTMWPFRWWAATAWPKVVTCGQS